MLARFINTHNKYQMIVFLFVSIAFLALTSASTPFFISLLLCCIGCWALKLHPRKTIDIGWLDLFLALKCTLWPFGRRDRKKLEASIASIWGKADETVVLLSVRTGFDLLLGALDLPKGSEVLFVPSISIPSVVTIIESHGLCPVGVDPPSHTQMLPDSIKAFVKPETRVLMLTNLFGMVPEAEALIAEAKSLGLVVIEDCAQAFLGASPSGQLSFPSAWQSGFRGHEGADASFVSFGTMKTLTALGGAVGRVRDSSLRDRMRRQESAFPVRPWSQFLSVVLKGFLIKIIGRPVLWGLVEAILSAVGIDFDRWIVDSVRGFPNGAAIRQRPSIPLLQLLLRRLRGQEQASFVSFGSTSTVAMRKRTAELIVDRLVEGGVTVPAVGAPCSWWLLPVLDSRPKDLVRSLLARGFDATCNSTQLKRVASVAVRGPQASSRPGGVDFMDSVVYLPLTPELSRSDAEALASAVLDFQRNKGSATRSSRGFGSKLRPGSGFALLTLLLAAAILLWPSLVLVWMPSRWALTRCVILVFITFSISVVLARFFAGVKELQLDPELLKGLATKPRAEGVAYSRLHSIAGGRIDGAVLLTGSTGFVGGGILFSLLARAKELGLTRIVLLIRQRSGKSAETRLKDFRASPIFDEVRDTFDELVVALEGDVAQRDFGWPDPNAGWPYSDPLKAVLHCAGDVRFDQPLQQAALSLISATLQMQQLASRWRAKRFLFVSTAFVHAVPSATSCLEEKLVELRDFDPMELYRDAVTHGKWAEKAMRDLGFPNTYTFAKAVAEHLVLRACESDAMDARIVRPSIVAPAWAMPWAGWAGDKPSTIVGGAVLLARRGLKAFRSSKYPCPLVPVDVVADVTVGALAGASGSGASGRILHAAVDASEASRLPSFKSLMVHLFQVLALRGMLPLPELGLMCRLLNCCENDIVFWMLHPMVNVLPSKVLALLCALHGKVLGLFGIRSGSQAMATAELLGRCSSLPLLYQPFTRPASAWLFRSGLRLPNDWDPIQYTLIIHRAAVAFAQPAANCRKGPQRGYADEFRNVQVLSAGSVFSDFFLSFSQPQSPLFYCVASFLIKRGLRWMNLTATLDAASLASVTELNAPLVLCPNHRSLLDFVLIGATCFQLRPIVPALQVPQVAADAEFASLPFLGSALAALGAFFVRRGGGSVQPDPALRAEVGRAFHRGRPLEVFLEGLRSRGRRQMRLRTGLLRALRDVSQRTVALVPLALSYELLPEDGPFYRELAGLPREPLRTGWLLHWALRGMRGELPPLGEAFLRLGSPSTLDASADLQQLVAGIQQQLVELTTVTALHAQALTEFLELRSEDVCTAFKEASIQIRESKLPGGSKAVKLADAELWPLVFQVATLMPFCQRLPAQWASWFVEGSDVMENNEAGQSEEASETPALIAVAAAFSQRLKAAEVAADDAAEALKATGIAQVTEEHLLQELLRQASKDGGRGLPPPLARGAASIVAARLVPLKPFGFDRMNAPTSMAGRSHRESSEVVPLWPTAVASPSSATSRQNNDEALDRWGFKDTRFVAQWVDGRPAVQITSRRYPGLGGQPLYQLWSFFQNQLGVPMSVRDLLPERPLPHVPEPADGLKDALEALISLDHVGFDADSRLRAGTGHGLADIWRLRTRELPRLPDAVVRPKTEEEVQLLLRAASTFAGGKGFAVIPVGGRTNVTSATTCPPKEVDPRPFVMLDMRALCKVVWVNEEDRSSMIEAGITGMALKEALSKFGVTMGMEPDSMEFSTLGGWIATRASGMKRARYGNIEDMILEVRIVTPTGVLWQRHGELGTSAPSVIGRASTNVALPGIVLGSEGCLGVVTSAVVRVQPLPKVVEYQSVVFPDWAHGSAWMREVARMPAALRPASCRLMDPNQLQLAKALRETGQDSISHSLKTALQTSVLRMRGVRLEEASAATLVFEGSKAEVSIQKKELALLVSKVGGVWGGASSGEAGYALTFAIAYLRDFGMDYRILSESLETMAPWSRIACVWPAVESAVKAEHRALRLPGRPFLSCRMTQLYDEGGVLYMYIAVCTAGLEPQKALEAFGRLEHAARKAAMAAGGCLSHHHGVGKLRSKLLKDVQSSALLETLHGLKASMDPHNILGARNGAWACLPDVKEAAQLEEKAKAGS